MRLFRRTAKKPQIPCISEGIQSPENNKVAFTHNFKSHTGAEQKCQVFHTSPVAHCITNMKDGLIVDVNGSFAKLFGYHRDELIGKNITDLNINYSEADRRKFGEMMQRQGSICNYETVARNSKGEALKVLLSYDIIESGQNQYILKTVIDITERSRIKKRILQINTQLEKKIRERNWEMTQLLEREKHIHEMKSKFVTMASHEFRTPLGVISTSLSLLEEYMQPASSDKTGRHFKRIRVAVKQLTEILNDFLSIDQLQQGNYKKTNREFNLKTLLNEVREVMGGTDHKENKIQLLYSGEEMIVQDMNIIRNILSNLLSNALKFSAEHRPVIISVNNHNKLVSISVQDHGIGIPVEEQPLLFTRFFRGSNTGNIQGTGLGLNIVKCLVDLIDGDISFSSRRNEGSTFTFSFRSDPQPVQATDPG
jgi:PAS domain S-box-containing protein